MGTPTTLNQLYFDAASRFQQRPAAMRIKANGEWKAVSWAEFSRRVQALSAALLESGLRPGDRIAILSENRPEWAIVDYACLTARLIDVPVYATLPAPQLVHILRDSGARIIFVSSAAQAAKVLSVRAELPALERLVLFDAGQLDGVESFATMEANGAAAVTKYPHWQRDALQVTPDDTATLIYTSGTTGDPKGVMLTHGNISSNVTAAIEVLPIGESDSCLSFLPLCHIFERMAGHYTMGLRGVVINYASSNEAVAKEIQETQPTLLASVPRIYEKIYARILDGVAQGSALRRRLFAWATTIGGIRLEHTLAKTPVPFGLQIQFRLADALVFSKLRERMGGRIRFAISGGAPLSPEICRFFLSAGIIILEGYGLTETSPVIAVNTFDMLKPGTVGRPLPNVEVKIAEDGEILTRGPHVMKGYYGLPDATAATIDSDAWFHTGDIGIIDNDGCLKITDRKKDLIVTAGGKNIAPQPIEALLKTNPFFVNAVMLGDRRKFPIMLLVPNFDTLGNWRTTANIPDAPPEEMVQRADVIDKLEREARKSFRDLAQFETPKKFLVLAHDFTIESGEITPKLSIKRKVVEEKHREAIERMYGDAGE